MKHTFYDLSAQDADGDHFQMNELEGKVVLIVNTASECGFNSQLNELEKLYKKYNDIGLEILAFPSNNFMNQEPCSATEARDAYSSQHGVSYKVMEKTDVKGEHIHPLFKYLTEGKSGLITNSIKWNFTKFLVTREGKVVKRYPPQKSPLDIEEDVKKYLAG
ncbi:hypothetical protein BN1048_00572 [Jeotgalicoccus saudimassiliensis]|uniref:Glutathione peroxidase n=1 Tax=Jeotgalicoccus saudimassiliensis TaxID=1461582 RepID=A0A078M4Q3_9STAP|nr:glutathione peroxidase [Jeotgalicoccus saudimassiliensis]CDZ99631.1 hypothetical protein BN1048_00572 [Jeotgalicoccus saudimassiliensis]